MKFYTTDKRSGDNALKEIDQELKYLDSLLNFFSENSLVSAINKNHKARLDNTMLYLFKLCDSIAGLTDGLFDISIAPLVEIWGFYGGEKRVPEEEEIRRAKRLVDYRKISLKGDSIFIPKDMKIDLSGIAQGFAADRVAEILKRYNIKSGIINIGGEVYGLGNSPKNRPWVVGIKNPRGGGVIEKIGISDWALATSGDYEKFFVINGIRYNHILNPKTGFPAEEFASVTVIAKNAAFADGIATAVAAMGAKRGIKFLDSLEIKGIIYYEENGELKRLESR